MMQDPKYLSFRHEADLVLSRNWSIHPSKRTHCVAIPLVVKEHAAECAASENLFHTLNIKQHLLLPTCDIDEVDKAFRWAFAGRELCICYMMSAESELSLTLLYKSIGTAGR